MSGRISDIMQSDKSNKHPGKRSKSSPMKDSLDNTAEDLEIQEDNCAVTVAVRLRPFARRELDDGKNKRVVTMEGQETIVRLSESSAVHRFSYDFSFCSFDSMSPGFASQQKVYEKLAQPLLERAFQGYNTCLFAYGQTGSGKSYSIMGHGEDVGIIPRFSEDLFKRIEDIKLEADVKCVNVETSFFEIYNEKIHDLIAPSKGMSDKKPNLRVREHPELGPYVEGLTTYPVSSFSDITRLLALGNKQRATASTGMNDKSSRSHSVFTMMMSQTKTMEFEETLHEHSAVSRINLVDLAGSERQSSAQTSGQRLKEGASINRSLLVLGKVISVLSEQATHAKKRKLFVPYRDSILTWLLKESLGGNARTAMIATISPSSLNLEETLSTLRYASQARSIINSARVNEDPKARLIRELRAEIERLKREHGIDTGETLGGITEILELRQALKEKEAEMEEKQKDWQEKLNFAAKQMAAETTMLEHTGISSNTGIKVDNKLPNLVNLNEDPQLSEILLYVLHKGQTKVGRQGGNHDDCDIQLTGALVADYHCQMINEDGKVMMTPIDDAQTFINGEQISGSVQLYHGDRVVIGGDHYFRFNHPTSVNPSKRASSSKPKDFQFAKSEIESVQNERLEKERIKIHDELQEKMSNQLQEAEFSYQDRLQKQKSEYETTIKNLQTDLVKQRSITTQAKVTATESELEKLDAKHLLDKLAAEKERLSAERTRWRNRPLRNQGNGSEEPAVKSIAAVPVERGKTDLYKVTLLIREANKISQHMGMPTVFTNEEIDNCVVVKVIDNDLGRYTYLTISKFEERLCDMRESFNAGESRDDSMPVFCSPGDTWRSSMAPNKQTTRLDDIVMNESRPTSIEKVINSPTTAVSKNKTITRSNSSDPAIHSNMLNVCKEFVGFSLHKFKAIHSSLTVFDQILRQCERTKLALANILKTFQEVTSDVLTKAEFEAEESTGASCMQLAASAEVLLAQCQLCGSMCDDLESGYLTETVRKMSGQSQKISAQIVQLMQALSSGIERPVHECSSSLLSAVFELCKLCGIMSVSTDAAVNLSSDSLLQLSPEVQSMCARGSLEHCASAASDKICAVEESLRYMDKNGRQTFAAESIYDAAKKVLRYVEAFLRDYREEVMVTLNETAELCSSEACHRYNQCMIAVSNLNIIYDNLSSLSKPMFTQGREYDRAIMLKGADAIKRACRKVFADTVINLSSLEGAVKLLFAVTEAEGMVKVTHKSASNGENRQKRILPPQPQQTELQQQLLHQQLKPPAVQKQTKRLLPPSPEGQGQISPFTKSPRQVKKMAALFSGRT